MTNEPDDRVDVSPPGRAGTVLGVARTLCDALVFRIGAAIALVPFAGFAFAALFYAGLGLVGLFVALTLGKARLDEVPALLQMIGTFGSFVVAFAGVVLRICFSSRALGGRPRLRRSILVLLAMAVAGLTVQMLVEPGPQALCLLVLAVLCGAGTLSPRPAPPDDLHLKSRAR